MSNCYKFLDLFLVVPSLKTHSNIVTNPTAITLTPTIWRGLELTLLCGTSVDTLTPKKDELTGTLGNFTGTWRLPRFGGLQNFGSRFETAVMNPLGPAFFLGMATLSWWWKTPIKNTQEKVSENWGLPNPTMVLLNLHFCFCKTQLGIARNTFWWYGLQSINCFCWEWRSDSPVFDISCTCQNCLIHYSLAKKTGCWEKRWKRLASLQAIAAATPPPTSISQNFRVGRHSNRIQWPQKVQRP